MYILAINNDFDWEVNLIQIQIYESDNLSDRVKKVILQLHEQDRIKTKTILMPGQAVSEEAKQKWSKNLDVIYREALEYIFKYNWKDLIEL